MQKVIVEYHYSTCLEAARARAKRSNVKTTIVDSTTLAYYTKDVEVAGTHVLLDGDYAISLQGIISAKVKPIQTRGKRNGTRKNNLLGNS